MAQLAEESTALYSVCRGDEPVETKILVDYARDLNFEVICAGKGKNNPLDPYATPESLTERAADKQMNPKMLTSFVDGSKAMIEMASLANTTGLGVSKRGMHGPASTVPTLHQTFALKEDGGILERAGVVDYCTGPVAPGVFVVVRTEDPYVHHEMTYLQMGDGPYFALYRPYHLASLEAPLTVYEMVLDHRPSLTSEHWTAEVGAQAKRPLTAGEKVDGIGGSMVRGLIDPSEDFARDGLVPLGVLSGAVLKRDVPTDHTLTYDDVELNEGSVIVRMRRIQEDIAEGKPAPSLTELPGDCSRGERATLAACRVQQPFPHARGRPWSCSPRARAGAPATTPTRCCCRSPAAACSRGRSAGRGCCRTSSARCWSSARTTATRSAPRSPARWTGRRSTWSWAATAGTPRSGRRCRRWRPRSTPARSTSW